MIRVEELKFKFNKNVLLRNVGKTTLAYNPETGDMYELNEVGRDIFDLLRQEYSIEELFEKLCDDYGTTKELIYKDVEAFIIRMLELGIINEL